LKPVAASTIINLLPPCIGKFPTSPLGSKINTTIKNFLQWKIYKNYFLSLDAEGVCICNIEVAGHGSHPEGVWGIIIVMLTTINLWHWNVCMAATLKLWPKGVLCGASRKHYAGRSCGGICSQNKQLGLQRTGNNFIKSIF